MAFCMSMEFLEIKAGEEYLVNFFCAPLPNLVCAIGFRILGNLDNGLEY